jgi:hypothetical protein
MKNVDSAVKQMLSDSNHEDAKENSKKNKSDESYFDDENKSMKKDEVIDIPNEENEKKSHFNSTSAVELLKNEIIPFPYRIARGLSPYVYKNIEFDMWFEMKRGKNNLKSVL